MMKVVICGSVAVRLILQKLIHCNPTPQQPRSFPRMNHRVDQALEDEPEAVWTCRKLPHRVEVASAVGAGTN